ncbi:unnamed protein product [Prorocentrum cordatum]|uniref:5'-3' exonuclease domain-containing protein n=1 Tax=Prorocentrum cordatum TaxID=2364126 RepID=A0ABN9RJ30_9DINO|nr:unnamed protein product [Polarella glacialis]
MARAAPPTLAAAAFAVLAAAGALSGAAIVRPLGGGRALASRPAAGGAAGRQSNALVGFSRFLVDYALTEEPTHVALCFDCSGGSAFRKKMHAGYKSNRPKAEAPFLDQLKRCKEFADALGMKCFESKKFEADDLIATLSTAVLSKGHRCTVVTVDKDLCQLVEPRLSVYDPAGGSRYDEAGVVKKFGVLPCQVVDMLGLVGDSADCIPGVRGIGPRTAAQLLQQFKDLDAVYAGLDKVATLGLRGAAGVQKALAAGQDIAFLSRTLATLEHNVPVQKASIRGMLRRRPSSDIHTLLDEFGLQSLGRQVSRLQRRMDGLP